HPGELDAVAYSFDPALCRPAEELGLADPWDWLRQEYARRAPHFIADMLPGLDPARVVFVPHHVAHAASAALAMPEDTGDCAVLVLDGRGEKASHLSGRYRDGVLEPLAAQELPHSLGLLYEDLTAHLGFLRSSDEYKVMALASYGRPRHLDLFRDLVRVDQATGGFKVGAVDFATLAAPLRPGAELTEPHADLAASVQTRLEEVILDLARWLHEAAGGPRTLALAGGVALNCVANARLAAQGPYRQLWGQPAAGDAGAELCEGQLPSPYMLFVHRVRDGWRKRIPAVVHVDGTARIQTVDPAAEPLVAAMLRGFERRTGLPVVVNTSLNTAGRPMVDTPKEALELFGSAPVDLLALGPFAVSRPLDA